MTTRPRGSRADRDDPARSDDALDDAAALSAARGPRGRPWLWGATLLVSQGVAVWLLLQSPIPSWRTAFIAVTLVFLAVALLAFVQVMRAFYRHFAPQSRGGTIAGIVLLSLVYAGLSLGEAVGVGGLSEHPATGGIIFPESLVDEKRFEYPRYRRTLWVARTSGWDSGTVRVYVWEGGLPVMRRLLMFRGRRYTLRRAGAVVTIDNPRGKRRYVYDLRSGALSNKRIRAGASL